MDNTNGTATTNARVKWTEASVREEAKKYNTRKEFNKGNQSAYQAARKLEILDAVCAHMEKVKRGRRVGQVAKKTTAATGAAQAEA